MVSRLNSRESVAGEAERSVEHHELFPHVNDAIRSLASEGQETEVWDFYCECPEVDCHTLVSLTLSEFDERRAASPPVAILATHHSPNAQFGR